MTYNYVHEQNTLLRMYRIHLGMNAVRRSMLIMRSVWSILPNEGNSGKDLSDLGMSFGRGYDMIEMDI